MKTIMICFSMLLFGLASQAQTQNASLYITLSDLQSVKFNSAPSGNVQQGDGDKKENSPLQVLNRSTSQIRQIDSKNSTYERLYQEVYNSEITHPIIADVSSVYKLADNRPISAKSFPDRNKSNLVIYQVDPR